MSNTSDVLERFLRYVQIDTTSSDEHAHQVPSTDRQFHLAQLLAQELKDLEAHDVAVSEHAYVTAHIPASAGAEDLPRLGLIAHLDTTEVAPGAGVAPHIVHYEGGDLIAGTVDGRPVSVSPDQMPSLAEAVGEDLVCTDGTTLLGADDKAGIAEIMALVARLAQDPSLPHPSLGICFCPDEEIGHGASLLDISDFGCDWAYTVDGGPIGEIEWECFNAAEAVVRVEGHSIHPGDAKGRMINAQNILLRYHAMLPEAERPEHTEGREGFFHLESMSGTVVLAIGRYIIRDHDTASFERRISLMEHAADFLNEELDRDRIEVKVERQYRNMAEVVSQHPQLISAAHEAFRAVGIEARELPIRGGTDGAQLSFRGLPCPNLSTGGYAMHSVNEFIPVRSLELMVDVLTELVARFAQVQE
ncbi:peptidase T [Collinsella sp. AGMB00827]|uniref:Peptidase T n=1 Tax=Collinsella ureilytica TaxID=2869515 RepID=A0ABS7MJN2_9ACTN|nr:peptidase T [Collinsella urealyticum]MBY4797581.1 peptidase T [Collinsella urealyticum]